MEIGAISCIPTPDPLRQGKPAEFDTLKKIYLDGVVATYFPNTLENYMNTQEIISSLDVEINRLRQVRELLAGHPEVRRGRPKGSTNKAQKAAISFNPAEFLRPKRTMSAEGKERIAAAQRARWARQHADAVASSPKKAGSRKALSAVAAGESAKSGLKDSLNAAASDSDAPKRKVGRPTKETKSAVQGKSPAEQAASAAA